MRLLHEFNKRSLELQSSRFEQQFSETEKLAGDVVDRKRRRKDFAELIDPVYKESIIDDLERSVTEAINNFCQKENYSELDKNEMTQMLNMRAAKKILQQKNSELDANKDSSSSAEGVAEIHTTRHRQLIVDSDSEVEEEEIEGYARELTDERIRDVYLQISRNYVTYSNKEKAQVVLLYEMELEWIMLHNDQAESESVLKKRARYQTCKHLKTIGGYGLIHVRLLRQWIEQKTRAVELRKRGPKVDLDFQREVWNSILLVIYEKDASSGQANLKIKANVVYPYEIIRYAAKEVQAKLCWLDDEKVQALQFSDRWIKGFLNRNKFNRKRITSEPKNIPCEAEVRRVMGEHQATYINMCFTRKQTANMDETALLTAMGPSYAYVPAAEGSSS